MTYIETQLVQRMAEVLYSMTCDAELHELIEVNTKPSKVFVYGTLRDGGLPTFRLEGYQLENTKNSGFSFPIVVPHEGSSVIGNVLEYSPSRLVDTDVYEGVPYLYRRKRVSVIPVSNSEGYGNQTPVSVWIYVPVSEELLSKDNLVIESGDWLEFTGEQTKKIDGKIGKNGTDGTDVGEATKLSQ